VHARFLHASNKQFFDTHFLRNFLERLLGVADGKGHENSSGPGRNLVDFEPEPVGKKNDFRRNGWDRVVVVLPEEAKIDFGEGIDFSDAAEFEDFLTGALQDGMIGGVSRELQSEVGFYRGANIRWAGRIDAPSAILILMPDNPIRRL